MGAVRGELFRGSIFLSPFHILRTDASIRLPVGDEGSRDANKTLVAKLLSYLSYGGAGVEPRAVVVAGDGVFNGGFAILIGLSRSLALVRS